MIKRKTQYRINIATVNYLNIVGIWKNKVLDTNNPVLVYFMSNMMKTSSQELFAELNSMKYTNFEELYNVEIPEIFFHHMILEFYEIYKKLDDIYLDQDENVKNTLYLITENKYDIDNYINLIFEQFKHSFYEILRYYNSSNPIYNTIKCKVLEDKMFSFAKLEDYEQAAILRDKIKDLKEKGE